MIKQVSVLIIFLLFVLAPQVHALTPSDEHYDKQWYLDKIEASMAWEKVHSSSNIKIAVIDSGVQFDHPDLKNNIWTNRQEIPNNGVDDDNNGFIDDYHGWDFIEDDPDPSPDLEGDWTQGGAAHGTVVSGIAAAVGNNDKGITGVTWDAEIMPLKVLDEQGTGKMSEVIRAVDYAVNNGADIINFSFVGLEYSEALNEAIKRAHDEGVIVVSAVGNKNGDGEGYKLDDTPTYPACNDGDFSEDRVVGVAATDELDQKASFSSYGFKCVDIASPGVSFFSTNVYAPEIDEENFGSHYDGYWSGTSMATPVVTGTLALILRLNPQLTKSEVLNILYDSADNISELNPNYLGQLGAGRVNVNKAVTLASEKLYSKVGRIITAPHSDHESEVSVNYKNGSSINKFSAYTPHFTGGANVTSGDVDGDGESEIITGAGSGGGPHVRVFSRTGKLQSQFFAYNSHFRGGVNVASGDVDGDGESEIITGAGSGGGPHVRVFSRTGKLQSQFFAYNSNFRGGVNVASGDVDADGKFEIITGAGPGGSPQVRIFNYRAQVLGQFLAYSQDESSGVRVASGDVDRRGQRNEAEIITALGPNSKPVVKVFDSNFNIKSKFRAFNKDFTSGVQLAVGDVTNNGLGEIIVGSGSKGGNKVRIYKPRGILLEMFSKFKNKSNLGINVGYIPITN